MANELRHESPGTALTQAEYELITAHAFDSQATGDIAYASSSTQLSRLAIGTTAYALTVVGGVPAWAVLTVPGGGTGAATLTDGGVLLGSGTGAITAMSVLADGSVIVGDGATDPVAITCFTSSTGTLIHERGGIEADISAITTLGLLHGTASGTMGILAGGTALQQLRVNAGATALEWATIAAAAVTALNSATENELVTVGNTTTELDAEADLTFDGTTLTLGGGQLAFPGTINPSAGANTLDEYEEASWTPGISDNSVNQSESQTYSTQIGTYIRIGELVTCWFDMTITSLGSLTTTQQATITGLPFTSASTAGNYGVATIVLGSGLNIDVASEAIFGRINNNQAYVNMNKWENTTGQGDLLVSEVTASGRLTGVITYRV